MTGREAEEIWVGSEIFVRISLLGYESFLNIWLVCGTFLNAKWWGK